MYELVRRFGRVSYILRIADNASIPIDTQSTDYMAFNEWNQTAGLDLSDQPLPSPTPAEVERARRLSVAVAMVAAVPESWETGTAQQQFSWACKQLFRHIRSEIDT